MFPKWFAMFTADSARERLDDALEGLEQWAVHEAASIDRHWLALRERVRVARRARGVGELLRNQIDLLPATTARLAEDHRKRVELLRALKTRVGRER